MARPVLRKPAKLDPKLPVRRYEVLVKTCVWGKLGEVIDLTLTDAQQASLLKIGTVKVADETPEVTPAPVSLTRPEPADSEGK